MAFDNADENIGCGASFDHLVGAQFRRLNAAPLVVVLLCGVTRVVAVL
jgi:hypothetical protein